jgi:pimeloyl-ACP methyl ester carboxylesterase
MLPAMLAATLLLTGCATSSRQTTAALWGQWRAIDQLQQPEYPDAVPIVLVHGWNGSQFSWPAPAELQQVRTRLHRDIYYFTYNTGIALFRYPPLEVVAAQLARYLANFKRVDIVAHSMGGLIVRQYLLHHGRGPIRRVVFLSTPHYGTHAAQLLADVASVSSVGNLQANEMVPGSDFLWQLDQAEGQELAGLQVLNVYVADKSFASSDLIVDTSSAFLPNEPNAAIVGDHHTPALTLDKLGFVLDFLQTGVFPEQKEKSPKPAPVPKRRDVWLRVMRSGKLLTLPESAVHRLDAKGLNVKSGLELCCAVPTGMNDRGQSTLVVKDVKPGEHLKLYLRDSGQQVDVDLAAAVAKDRPVALRLVEVPPVGSRLPASLVRPGGLMPPSP